MWVFNGKSSGECPIATFDFRMVFCNQRFIPRDFDIAWWCGIHVVFFFWTIHWFESTTWCHKSFLVAISTERNGSMEEEWRLIDSLFKALVLVSDWPSGNQNWNWNSQTCLHLSMISLLKSVVVQFHVWLHAYIYRYIIILYIYRRCSEVLPTSQTKSWNGVWCFHQVFGTWKLWHRLAGHGKNPPYLFFRKREMYETRKSLFQIEDLGDVLWITMIAKIPMRGFGVFTRDPPWPLALTARRFLA